MQKKISNVKFLSSVTFVRFPRLTHTPRKTGGRGWTLDNVGKKGEKTRKSHVSCSPLKNRVFKGKIGGFD